MGAKPQGRSGTGASRRSGSAFTAPVQRADVRDDLKNKRQNGFQFAVCSGAFDGFRQGPLETKDVDFAALFSLTGFSSSVRPSIRAGACCAGWLRS